MTVVRMLLAAFCALAAGVAVENAKASAPCAGSEAGCQIATAAPARER